MKRDTRKDHPWRLRVVMVFWLLMLAALVSRAFYLHVIRQDFLEHQGEIRNLRVVPVAARRGVITDRNGRPLAVSTPVTTLWANPGKVLDARKYWDRLKGNPVLNMQELAEAVKGEAEREFVYLVRQLPPEKAELVLREDIPGIYSMTEYRRYYPAGKVASHVVGVTNIDGQGIEGIELAFNEWLQADSGRKKVVRDLLGRVIRVLKVIEPAEQGKKLTLSIDLRIQYVAYRALANSVKEHNAASGTAVVVDSKTGEVLAMVNYPSYNPNDRVVKNLAARRNRAVTDVFEPGSTIKPFTMAVALEEGVVEPSTTVNTAPGYIVIDGEIIRDHINYGVLDIRGILVQSSNVGASIVALRMDEHLLPGYLRRFGFGHETGVRFPGERSGSVPWRAQWRDVEQAALAYGYGLSVTALQLARAYAVLANEGVRVPLTLRKRESAPRGRRIISTEVANTIVDMLQSVVSKRGTGGRAEVDGYQVAGKTGTVHLYTDQGYASSRYLGVFAGMAPGENPRYVCVVMVKDPRVGGYYGALVAAPVFQEIMAAVLRLRGVTPRDPARIWAGGEIREGRT